MNTKLFCQVCRKREAEKTLDETYHGIPGVRIRTCRKCPYWYMEVRKSALRLQRQMRVAIPVRRS